MRKSCTEPEYDQMGIDFFFLKKQTEKQVSLNSCKAGITEAIFIGLYFYARYMVSCRFFNCLYLKDTGNQNRQ